MLFHMKKGCARADRGDRHASEASHVIRAAGKDVLSFFVIAGQQRHNVRIVSAENDPECFAKAV